MANRPEWQTFRASFPAFGIEVNDESAGKMAKALDKLVGSVMEDRFSSFRYSVVGDALKDGSGSVPP